jgi:hypothetical protein
MGVALLADFAVRLACGLILALLLMSWRAVPLRFFRIQSQVILGVLVLAGLAQARTSGLNTGVGLIAATAVLAYLGTVAWGLGLPRLGLCTEILGVVTTAVWMIGVSRAPDWGVWALNATSRGVCGFLVGATLTAMLLGHYYLIAPAMTIEPLKRAVAWIAVGLVARGLLAAVVLWVSHAGWFGSGSTGGRLPADGMLLAARWGIGLAGAAFSVELTRRTVRIRSTQSATGILYITTIFVLFGELTSMIAAGAGLIG